MTDHRDLKKIIRQRQRRTGESYTAARRHIMRERARLLGVDADRGTKRGDGAAGGEHEHEGLGVDGETQGADSRALEFAPVEAAVLKVNDRSIRVRIVGEPDQVTFRSSDVGGFVPIVPGHVVTLRPERRWRWRGDAYASGGIDDPRVDVPKLQLTPLPLQGGELEDVASDMEPYEPPDPYAPLWKELTAKPRPSYELDGIAWGALPGRSVEDNPTCDAAELAEQGDFDGARDLLMEVLCEDLRCLDAHAHLGNLAFDRSPRRAMLHYEIGILIGELSLPEGFDGLLTWGQLYNRAFLRCLHGYGLCLWRLGEHADAQRVFERILSLNPNDHQGVRFCWYNVRRGRSWEEMTAAEDATRAERRRLIDARRRPGAPDG